MLSEISLENRFPARWTVPKPRSGRQLAGASAATPFSDGSVVCGPSTSQLLRFPMANDWQTHGSATSAPAASQSELIRCVPHYDLDLWQSHGKGATVSSSSQWSGVSMWQSKP